MRLRDDERGQSVQVGAVLLFGVFIIAFSSYQAFVVPQQNAEVEFNHNQQVHQQMQDLRNAFVSGSTTGQTTAISVHLGTQYPSRAVAMNPGRPSGTLRTDGTTHEMVNVSIRNAVTDGETGDVWDGSQRNYTTGSVVYQPSYNVYDNAPTTVYEQSVLYNDFRDGQVVVANQSLVDGKTISLVVINGSFDRGSSGSTTVDVRTVSGSSNTVQIEDDGGDPIRINFTSRRPASEWQFLENQPTVDSVEGFPSAAPGPYTAISVTMATGNEYTLGMKKVGVGTGVDAPDDPYLVDVDGGGESIDQGESKKVTLEVRDEFNNPLSDVTVEASTNGSNAGTFLEGSNPQKTSGDDGKVSFTYVTDTTTNTRTNQLNFSINETITSDGDTPHLADFASGTGDNVTMTVTVSDASSGFPDGDLVLRSAGANDGPDSNSVPGGVDMSMENTYGESAEITEVSVKPTDSSIDVLADISGSSGPMHHEFYVDGDVNDGFTDYSALSIGGGPDGVSVPVNADLDIDGRNQNGNPVISDGATFTIYLYEFFEDQDTATNVDMSDKELTVTVTYRLSSNQLYESKYTFTPATTSVDSFSGTSATDVLPRTHGQQQTVTFTPDSSMASGETVDIVLDEAQQASPEKVDYQNAGVNRVTDGGAGGSASFTTQGTDAATITYTAPSGGLASGQQVSVRVNDVNVGPDSNLADPYSVTFDRSDGGSTTSDFTVARGSGSSGFSTLEVTDVQEDSTGEQQLLRFTPDSQIDAGEKIAIDLSVAQDPNQVDYRNAGVNGVSDGGNGGSAQFTNQTDTTAVVVYTAGTSVPAGQQVELDVGGIDTAPAGSQTDPYTVGSSRGSADTGATTFSVTGGNNPPSVTIDSTSVVSIGGTGNGKNHVDVTFTGSDPDADTTSYTVELYDSSSKTTLIDSASDGSYTGGTTSERVTDNSGGPNDNPPYWVVVTVTDANGNSDTAEQSA